MNEQKTGNLFETDMDDSEADSSNLSSNSQNSEKIKVNITPILIHWKKISEHLNEEKNNQNIKSNFKIPKNIKKSLEYLRQLTKEDLADTRQFTLNSY